ncbi:MAG TPA: hypothetical protein VIU33_07480 [Nitrospiria bacterium]
MVQGLKERTRAIRTVRALVTIRPEGERAFTARLEYSRNPADGSPVINLTGFDPLGRPAFEMNTWRGSTRFMVSRNGSMTEVSPDHPDLGSLPLLPADIPRLVSAVVGPVIRPGEIAVLEEKGLFYIIHLIEPGEKTGRLSQRLWINRAGLDLVNVEIFGNGSHGASGMRRDQPVLITLSELEERMGGDGVSVSWPGVIQIDPLNKETGRFPGLNLEFREVHLNEKLAAGQTKRP